MPELRSPEEFLAACAVNPAVYALRPDYRVLLLVVDGVEPEMASSPADELITRAERHARALLASSPVEDLPHVAARRDAYRAFGAKPQRTRNGLEALTRRAEKGLPRVNALTNGNNALSVLHQIPLGGEDFHRYVGPARLMRAIGDEPFDAVANGQNVVEHPKGGEVVWCDGGAVTCRRWNWWQGRRTALSDDTRSVFFILDALAPITNAGLPTAADALAQALSALGFKVRVSRRLVVTP